MAQKMPFQAVTAFGASGSAFSSTVQVTAPASQPVYLATSSQTILQGILPSWCYIWMSSTGSGNGAFQVNPDGVGTTWQTVCGVNAGSMTVVYLDGTGGQRVLNNNAVAGSVFITAIKQ